jgi:glycogen debranching enzyme
MRTRTPPSPTAEVFSIELQFDLPVDYRRKGVHINLDHALKIYNVFRPDCFDEDTRIRKCGESFRKTLESYNQRIRDELNNHMNYAIDNALAGARYERVQHDGPKFRTIDISHPVFTPYFTHTGAENVSIQEAERMMYSDAGKYFMAHNGWVMGHDALVDFARPQKGIGNVYLRRELIA